MRRAVAVVISLLFLLPLVAQSANAAVSLGGKCSPVGKVASVRTQKFVCSKNGSKMIWVRVKSPVQQIRKLNDSDSQFFIATPGCENRIEFVRVSQSGIIIRERVIVRSIVNVEAYPYSYEEGNLLFGTFDCVSQKYSVYSLVVTDSKSRPRLLYQSDSVGDATWDIATGQALVLTNIGTQRAVYLIGNAPTLVWTQGEYNTPRDFYPTTILGRTGKEFLLFDSSNFSGGWSGFRINFDAGFGTLAYTSTGRLFGVAEGFLDTPTAFSLDSGAFVCGTALENGIDPKKSSNCLQIGSNSNYGTNKTFAFAFGKDNDEDLFDGSSVYSVGGISLLGMSGNPTLAATRTLSASFPRSIIFESAFEPTLDIGILAPQLTFDGGSFLS